MSIVEYHYTENGKIFYPDQVLRDCGWGIKVDDLALLEHFTLIDRVTNQHVHVEYVRYDRYFNMYFLHFEVGGWLVLDHAIEQFIRLIDKS